MLEELMARRSSMLRVASRLITAFLLLLLPQLGATQQQGSPPAEADSAKAQAERQVTQPLNNAPVWRDVRGGENPYQTTQVRGIDTNVLIQTQGEIWRQIRNGPITVYGGWLLIIILLAIAAFYLWKGPIKVHGQPTGRRILRFTVWDRTIHWTVAISFVILGLSGLVLLFGKYILLPVFGYTLFSWLGILSKNLHNFVGPVFLIAAALMFFTYLGRNIPRAYDITWLSKAGGMISGKHVPSGFFNAGEKIVFWAGLFLFSIIVGVSGLILLFPNLDQGRIVMQYANVVHAVTAVLYMGMMFGHMYLGTVGLEGAWENMRYDGLVDETWAKEHHEYWYNEEMARRARAGSGAPSAAAADSLKEGWKL
jgi:formate dehydrogenase subunit gamma